uniref:Calmodulin-binding domain-containing protein n=1 Tax=Plectus sambesii TaxID=2011161 RepID=A0A914WW78_9BILA
MRRVPLECVQLQGDSFSLALRWMILASTIALDVLILMYHFVEIKISLVDTGSEYWRVGVTSERLLKVLTELVICSMCPLPGTGYVNWPILKSKYTDRRVELPFDVLLCLPMFLRCYILCRFMVLHSAQFQDAATRTIAVLNQITVDFPFVVKTQLFDRPLAMICAFTGSFWFCMAWMLAQCERYTDTDTPGLRHFLNFIWFEIVTFFSIGYGDVVPQTYCGRALAISTGIVGTFVSSLIIALVGRRMQLSLAERRVNQVIAESQLSNSYKNTAASVLQHIWFVHKYRKQLDRHGDRGSKRITFRIRIHQRSLLQAILAFRRVRWRLRMRLEEEDEYIAFRRAYVETQERMTEFRKKQNQLRTQLATLNEKVESLSDIFASPSCIILPPTNQTRKAISAIDLHRLPSI